MLDSNSSELGYLTCNSSQLLIDTTKTADTSLVYDYGLTCSYEYLRYEINSPLRDVEIIQLMANHQSDLGKTSRQKQSTC